MKLSMFDGVWADKPDVIDSEDLWENIRKGTWEKISPSSGICSNQMARMPTIKRRKNLMQ